MNIEKRNNYETTMSLNGIDTLSGYVDGKMLEGKSLNVTRNNYKPNIGKTYLIINPNKNTNGERLITKYSEFLMKMEKILQEMGATLEELDIIRSDFCFNSQDEKSFEDYRKLHRLLISCLAKAYKYKNCYVSCDLWDFKPLSIAIKKDDSEAENYDKKKQSNGKDESSNRLELRSKDMSGTSLEYQFMERWFERLNKAKKCFKEVQQEANDHLEKLYKEDLKKDKKDRNYVSLTAFLLQHKESIYCTAQMVDLLGRFEEVTNPERKAKKFKEKHNIEYFSQRDLDHIVKVLENKTKEYFNS